MKWLLNEPSPCKATITIALLSLHHCYSHLSFFHRIFCVSKPSLRFSALTLPPLDANGSLKLNNGIIVSIHFQLAPAALFSIRTSFLVRCGVLSLAGELAKSRWTLNVSLWNVILKKGIWIAKKKPHATSHILLFRALHSFSLQLVVLFSCQHKNDLLYGQISKGVGEYRYWNENELLF